MSTTPTVGVTHSGYNSLDLARRINEEYPTPKHSPSTQHYPRPHRGRTSRSHSDPKLQVKDHKSSVSRYVPPIPTGILDDPSSAASAESSTTDANNPPSGLIRSLSTPSAPHRVNSHTPSPLPPVTTRSYSATDQTRKPKMDTNNGHHRNGTGAPDRQPLLSSNEDDPASRRRAESLRRKLRTYEAILALRNGCMPDTEQMVAWGRHALRSSALDSRNRKLSPKGRELIRDARAWVEALMDLALTKNYDDKLQEFIWFTSRAGMKTGGADVGAAVRAGASGGGKDLGRLMERLRGLVGLLWSSEEFRGLLNEFTGRFLVDWRLGRVLMRA